MKTTRLFLLAIGVSLTASQAAAGQIVDFYSSPGYSALINNLINNHIWNSSMERYTKNYKGKSGGTKSNSKLSTPAATPAVPAYRAYKAVQFKPNGTRITLQPYLDELTISPQDKAEVKALVLKIFKDYEAAAAAKGYPNDWALAYVSSVRLNSHVYHGKTEPLILPFEQNLGLRDVVAEYATDNGTFTNISDAKKQELYELLVMLGGMTYHFYEKALRENNAEEIKNSKLAAAENLRILGIKP